MPEIAEVHRVVHFLRRHLVNRKIKQVLAQEDDIVYGKVGCSASAFRSALAGKTVLDVKQQGKYFWLVMNAPPHPLMHLGMTGWVIFSNDDSAYYRKKKLDAEWPPKYWKFQLEMDGKPDCKVAFIDARRLARIRLIHAAAEDMRNTTPLKENGPDPMVDKDVFTVDWFKALLQRKKVPVKALLLNQANISGIGNWVADEVLYHARIHPEQYSNTFTDAEMERIHANIIYVCTTACEALADSTKFPKDWLMRHRWGKGRKEDPRLPSGESITYVTVGGRTSAVVESLQKKTGPVSENVKVETAEEVSDVESEPGPPLRPVKKSKLRKESKPAKEEKETASTGKKRKRADSITTEQPPASHNHTTNGRRRSTRNSTQAGVDQQQDQQNVATPSKKKASVAKPVAKTKSSARPKRNR